MLHNYCISVIPSKPGFASAAAGHCWRLVLLSGPVSLTYHVPFQVLAACDEISNIWCFTSCCFSACVLTDNAQRAILSCWIKCAAYRKRCSKRSWGSWAPSFLWPPFCLEKPSCPCAHLSFPCLFPLSPHPWLGIMIPLQHSTSRFVNVKPRSLW